ncbi:MAG: circadian clock KaiB family protein [Marmoricola sp.]
MTTVSEPRWTLTLYVSGASPRSAEAIVAIRRICDEDLAGRADLTVVNAADHPALVKRDHILALPTLVKLAPEPQRHLVGNLTDLERVRTALDLGPRITDWPPTDLGAPAAEGGTT